MTGSREIGVLLGAAAAALSAFRHIPGSVRAELGQEAVTRYLDSSHVRDPRPFVRRVARNLAIDWVRKSRYEQPCAEPWSSFSDGARWQHQIDAHLDVSRAAHVLQGAPRNYQELADALFFQGLELEELVDHELSARGVSRADTKAMTLVRDALYKRRSRTVSWIARQLALSQAA